MRKSRVKLKFLLNELDKMCKKYYASSLKEAFLDSPRYKYRVISKNKQSRSLLRKMKSFVLPYERLEQVSPGARVYPGPESNEFTVKFSDLASKVESAPKVNLNIQAYHLVDILDLELHNLLDLETSMQIFIK